MTTRFTTRRDFATILGAALLYGLLLYALLPDELTPGDRDEFGFIKSVVKTLQHGRPWTDDYLEPWAASLSAISAVVFALTHSMRLALQGPQVVFGALGFFGLAWLLRRGAGRLRPALIATALVFLSPVLLRRMGEFSDFVLILPSLIGCVWAAELRRWGIFLAIACVAIASRQSALTWLVLPACAAAGRGREPAPARNWRTPALVVAGGIVWFGLVALAMNLTEIQFDRTLRTLTELRPVPLGKTLLALGAILLTALGAGAFVARAASGRLLGETPWRGAARWWFGALALALLLIDPRALIEPDDRYGFLQGTAGGCYAKLIMLLSAAGWVGGPFRVRRDLLLGASAAAAAIALRQIVYDRYAAEVLLLGFLAVMLSPQPLTLKDTPRWAGCGFMGIATAVAVFHLCFGLRLKLAVDEIAASCLAHERALRAGQLRPSELFNATAAFRGWYLHAHSVAHPLPGGRKAAGYVRFSEPTRTVDAWVEHPAPLARFLRRPVSAPAPAASIVATVEFRAAWFWQSRYIIVRRAPATEPPVLGRGYHPTPFPLSDAEWLTLARDHERPW